jgi:hypothetical protein
MSMRARMWLKAPAALLASCLLGAGTALLTSCGSTGKLIPLANSEPLQKDFQEVASAAENAHGTCASTGAALERAQRDFNALPTSVDAGLRRRLGEGLSKLRGDALELCAQPAAGTTATTPPRTAAPTPTSTTPTTTPTTNTPTTPTTTNPTTSPGGGTPVPKEGEGEGEPSKRKGGGAEPEAGAGGGAAPSQEGGK